MRLTEEQQRAVREEVARVFGDDTLVHARNTPLRSINRHAQDTEIRL